MSEFQLYERDLLKKGFIVPCQFCEFITFFSTHGLKYGYHIKLGNVDMV